MDSNGKNIPVFVTVATETEPTTVDGTYCKTADGFVIDFEIGTDKFVISHSEAKTSVKATGVMSYDITLGDDVTYTTLATPFGKVRFAVKTQSRKVTYGESVIRIMLCYVLSADGVGDMARSVDVSINPK